MADVFDVLLSGEWKNADIIQYFSAINPCTREMINEFYPVSSKNDVETSINSGFEASKQLKKIHYLKRAEFFEKYVELLKKDMNKIIQTANIETGYPISPRLADIEFPRMTNQILQAAKSVREHSWEFPVIDSKLNIKSINKALNGPVAIFSPNNFPLAFNCVSGSDFVGAIACGNSVICKANPSHPGTTRLLAECAYEALKISGLPLNTIQLLYHIDNSAGLYLAGNKKLGAISYTGSKEGGLRLKQEADKNGIPIYLELSSINPVFIFPKALKNNGKEISKELISSCLLGSGQFCTKPGIVFILNNESSQKFIDCFKYEMENNESGILLSEKVLIKFEENLIKIRQAGAKLLSGGTKNNDVSGYSYKNTLMSISGNQFLDNPEVFQTEAFGNQTLIVEVENEDQLTNIIDNLNGTLTASIYFENNSDDEILYEKLNYLIEQKAGRILNNKMPTGVAVVSSMHHGGPYPSTSHPFFSSVGIPFSFLRFCSRKCYDNVDDKYLPEALKKDNPQKIWRLVDNNWSNN